MEGTESDEIEVQSKWVMENVVHDRSNFETDSEFNWQPVQLCEING